MDEAIKKKAIVQAMSEIECYPIIQEDTDVQEYTKVPLGQISAMGAIFASVAPALQNAVQNMTTSGVGEKLYKMIVPNGIQGTVNSVVISLTPAVQSLGAQDLSKQAHPPQEPLPR